MDLNMRPFIDNTLNSLTLVSKGKGRTKVAQRRSRFASGLQVLDIIVHVLHGATPLYVVFDSILSLGDVYAGNHKSLFILNFGDRDQRHIIWWKLLSPCVDRYLYVSRVKVYVNYFAQTEHEFLLVERQRLIRFAQQYRDFSYQCNFA